MGDVSFVISCFFFFVEHLFAPYFSLLIYKGPGHQQVMNNAIILAIEACIKKLEIHWLCTSLNEFCFFFFFCKFYLYI